MKRLIFIWLLLFFVVNLFSQNEKRLALVIGNASYISGGVLKNPVNDANLMAQTLTDLGFEVKKLINANLRQMQDAAVEFTTNIQNNKVALFYYAGHGVQVDGVNYLIPVDAQMNDKLRTRYEAFDISDINYAFAQNSGNMNIMILDACRNDPFRTWMRGGTRGFKAVGNQAAGTIIAFATREGQTASDGSGNNGLFTEKLVQEMKLQQNITEVFQNTRVEVLKATNNEQCPQEWNMLTGNFSFTTGNNIQTQKANNTEPVTGGLVSGEVVYDYGEIVIDTEIGGQLFLDGKYMGDIFANSKGNKLVKQLVGSHSIKIVGKETWQEEIVIGKDRATYLNVSSKKVETGERKDLPNVLYDARDGKTYKTVQIGTQTWMAENLAFAVSGSSFVYENNQSYLQKYGYLYSWETAKNVCPSGWHLPSDEEWETLAKLLNEKHGPFRKDAESWTEMGKLLKATAGWKEYAGKNGNGTDDYGFNAVASGYQVSAGKFNYKDEYGYWWSNTAFNSTDAFVRTLYNFSDNLYRYHFNAAQYQFSVRCLKN